MLLSNSLLRLAGIGYVLTLCIVREKSIKRQNLYKATFITDMRAIGEPSFIRLCT